MENTKVKIELDSKDALSSIKDLNKALKAAKDEMVGLEPGSEAFKIAAKRAGELKHNLDDVNKAVRGASADFGTIVSNIAKVGAGISGAFQAAQGAMNLFGVESENVTEAIQKMQSMMALTQGLSSINEGIESFRNLKISIGLNSKELGFFKKALIGTGLGALVVVLGSIIANWEDFTKEIGLSEKQMNKLGETFGGVANVILKSSGKIAQAFAKIVKGDFSGAWNEIKQGWDFQAMYAEGVQKSITEREQKELEKRKTEFQKYVDKRNEQLDTERSKAEATIEDEQKRNEELIRIETERLKLYKEGTKEYYDQLKKIKDLEKSEADRQKSIADEAQKQKDKENEEKQKELDNIKNRVQAIKDSYRDELQVIKDEEYAKKAVIQKAFDEQLISETEFENLKTQIEKEAADKRAKIQQDEANLAAEYARTKLDVGLQMANSFASIFNSMADIIGEDSEEAFKASQAFQISSAIINTLSGAIGAYTGAVSNAGINAIPLVGPELAQALGISSAAAVAASGAAQIAQISRRKWNDKSTSGINASSGAARASISQPARNINSSVQFTQDIQGAETIGAIKDQRVYVTETDITSTQRKVDIVETESVF